ncbi:hypothetical protein [Oscillibacter sp.]|uniref:hypothetical protein n=1 Tax=Oscillibacter sp. TaxID=1945593 RepID=UPI00339B7702
MNRYQVITYSRDIGADEKRDYKTLEEASAAVLQKLSFRPEDVGVDEAALVYDLKEKRIRAIWGFWPESAKPKES